MHDLERTMGINYFAPAKLTLGVLPHMVSRGGGHIVNCLSTQAQYPCPRFSAYSASKSAISAFSAAVSAEVLSDGIYFSDMYFPLVATDMLKDSAFSDIKDSGHLISVEQAVDRIVEAISAKSRSVDFGLKYMQVFSNLFPGLSTHYLNIVHDVFHEDVERAEGMDFEKQLCGSLFGRAPF